MAVQDTYAQYQDAGFEGDVADGQHAVIISREVETAALAFGRAVTHGATDRGIVAGGANVFQGVSVRKQVQKAANTETIPVGDTADVLQEGVIRVKVTVAVTPEDAPGFATADGTFAKSDTAAHTAVPGGRYESSAAIGELALLRLS